MMELNMLLNTIKANTNMEVNVNMVQKGKETLTGITIGDGTIRPTVYVERFEYLFDGNNYDDVAKEMLAVIKEQDSPSINIEKITDWEYAKTNLKLCIAPKGTNEGFVTYPYLDLEMYIRVIVLKENDTTASYKVNESMLEKFGVTKETLFHAALDCTKPTYEVRSFVETIAELMGIPVEELPNDGQMVIKAKDGLNGASVIYCKDILKGIADSIEDDLIVLPSSIHEILTIPASQIDLKSASEMVKEVNETQVTPEELLSDHAYYFNRETMEITY